MPNINIFVTDELHQKLRDQASFLGKPIYRYVTDALEETIVREKMMAAMTAEFLPADEKQLAALRGETIPQAADGIVTEHFRAESVDESENPIGPADEKFESNEARGGADTSSESEDTLGPADHDRVIEKTSGGADAKRERDRSTGPADHATEIEEASGGAEPGSESDKTLGPADRVHESDQPHGGADRANERERASGPSYNFGAYNFGVPRPAPKIRKKR